MIFYMELLTVINEEVDLLWLIIKKPGVVVFVFFVEISHMMLVCHIISYAGQSIHSKPTALKLFSRKKKVSLFCSFWSNNFSFTDLQCSYAPLYLLFVLTKAILV